MGLVAPLGNPVSADVSLLISKILGLDPQAEVNSIRTSTRNNFTVKTECTRKHKSNEEVYELMYPFVSHYLWKGRHTYRVDYPLSKGSWFFLLLFPFTQKLMRTKNVDTGNFK